MRDILLFKDIGDDTSELVSSADEVLGEATLTGDGGVSS